ncbi:MAG: GspH/FimT family pseudopilin [Gammaproteobacteria bacterium]|nr:GspH/FimT family pseudopilin [Gammaproteobacteria bacterium]
MSRQNGFSLIEVIVTMAIAAIVLSIGIPSFQSYTQNNRQTIAINGLATALQLARNSAVSRRIPVTLCKSPNGTNCVIGGGSGDWSQGWMIFTNPNGINGVAGLDPNAGEELLRVHGRLQGNSTLIGNNNVINQITFSPQGLALGSNGTITNCDSRGNTTAAALVISVGGQVRQAEDTDNDGIVENGAEDPVPCP